MLAPALTLEGDGHDMFSTGGAPDPHHVVASARKPCLLFLPIRCRALYGYGLD